MDPINYSTDVATPFQAALQGYQGGAAIRNDQFAQQQQQAQVQQVQQQRQVINGLITNPRAGAQDYARAMIAVPQLREQLDSAWKTLNTAQQQSTLSDLSQWGAAVANGQPQVAADQMDAQADAMENSNGGRPTPQSQALRVHAQVVKEHPEFALFQIQSLIAAHPDGSKLVDSIAKLAEQRRADQLQPSKVATAEAEAAIKGVDAEVAPTKVRTDIANTQSVIADRAARLGLDQDKFVSEQGLKVAELRRKPGAIDLPDSALTIVNKAAGEAQVARQSAAQLNDLADQFEKADPNSFGAGTYEFLKQATGQQDYVTALRKEYVRLRSTQVNTLLPPGPASDVDIKNAMAGFPKETANPQELASFMRGLAKLQNYSAQVEDSRSEWVNQVGSLGKPSRDIEVGGVKVPAGSTFSEFAKKALKPIGAQTQSPANATLDRLTQKYGGGAGGATGTY